MTTKGEERTRAACDGLRRLLGEGRFFVSTSPLERCLQTAKLLAEALPDAELHKLGALAPGGSYHDVLRHLERHSAGQTLVLVGHEPDLGKLAGLMLFGAPAALPLKKGGACLIQFVGSPAAGKGQLRWFLPPRSLRHLARRKAKA